ncbi:MAG TPA: fibronectin type III domain-containing protein [Verrucomicrobiae bacterium]|nr:fibronectin type III domain-containing protein [Verrucomicrobiae bacterium]
MRFVTNKLLAFALALAVGAVPVSAAPTEFSSPGYTIGGVIFGGTGTLRYPVAFTPPAITAGPTVSAITITSAVVTWTTDRATTGIVFVGSAPGDYEFQAADAFTPTISSHSVELNFLTKNTAYYYKVRSVDTFGNAVESAEATFNSDAGDITAPTITNGPVASQVSGTQVTITWITDELSNSIVDYGIQSVADNSTGRFDERSLFHQVTLAGLLGNQTYKFRVKSTDSSGNTVTSNAGEVTTISSPGITEVRITDVTLNSAVVQWQTTVPSTTTIAYGTSAGNYSSTIDDLSVSESHLVRLTGLENGTTYYVRLSGLDGSGTRLTSDEYLFKTVILPRIDDFTIFDIQSRSAKLKWVASTEVDAFVRYEILKAEDPKLNGKKLATGDDKLAIEHEIQLEDLEANTEYGVSLLGKDIFGNQAISPSKTFTTLPDREPPTIENLRSDTTVDLGSRQTVQVLISFGVSEAAKAVIEYGEGATGPFSKKIETDTDYTTNKFMVIPGLRPGESYHFKVVVTDRSGNVAESAEYNVLAPAKQVSLLDLIFGQLRMNFGWLTTIGQ